jgi:diaminopimelate decarboxylase
MFEYRHGSLHAESVPLEAIAREFGTPCYVYSRAALARALSEFQSACSGHGALVCYAMKASRWR